MPPWNAAGTRVSKRARDLRRQREREMPRRAADVAHRIERAVNQRQRRRAQHAAPERKLPERGPHPARARQAAAPTAGTRSRAPPAPAPARGKRLPGRRKLRQQDAPRHSVHRQMMDGQQQPAGCIRPGVEPHRLHHHPGRRRKPALAPLAPPRLCTRAVPPHQAQRCRSRRRQSPAGTAPGGATSRRHGGCCRAAPSRRSRNAS